MDFERQSSPLRGERKEHGKTAAFVSLIKAQPVPGRYDLVGRVGRLLGAPDQLLIDWLSYRRTEIKWGGGRIQYSLVVTKHGNCDQNTYTTRLSYTKTFEYLEETLARKMLILFKSFTLFAGSKELWESLTLSQPKPPAFAYVGDVDMIRETFSMRNDPFFFSAMVIYVFDTGPTSTIPSEYPKSVVWRLQQIATRLR